MPDPGMYRGDRRRKEDQRKAKLEAKKARKAERRETGTSGPEIADQAEVGALEIVEFVWFSPSKGRTLTTPNKAAPSGRDRRLDAAERAASSGRSRARGGLRRTDRTRSAASSPGRGQDGEDQQQIGQAVKPRAAGLARPVRPHPVPAT